MAIHSWTLSVLRRYESIGIIQSVYEVLWQISNSIVLLTITKCKFRKCMLLWFGSYIAKTVLSDIREKEKSLDSNITEHRLRNSLIAKMFYYWMGKMSGNYRVHGHSMSSDFKLSHLSSILQVSLFIKKRNYSLRLFQI